MDCDSTFYQLPEELLTMIVEQLWWENGEKKVAQLKTLRLTCPRFAYLEAVQFRLFHIVSFYATPEHVENLLQANLESIAPYVVEIEFWTPLDAVALTNDEFYEYLLGDRSPVVTDLPEFDIAADELYKEYEKEHVAVQEVINGDDLRKAWGKALKEFGNKACVLNVGSKLPLKLPLLLETIDDIQRFGLLGDRLVLTVAGAIADAKYVARNLLINCTMTTLLSKRDVSVWNALDLSGLWTFHISDTTFILGRHECVPTSDDNGILMRQDPITALLEKARYSGLGTLCIDLIQVPDVDYPDVLSWPSTTLTTLPHLNLLRISRGFIDAENLALWIEEMPALQVVKMGYARVQHSSYWFFIFDAIRDHENAILFESQDLLGMENEGETVPFSHQTDDIESLLEEEEVEDFCDDLHRSLGLYLSGQIEMNECLSVWFNPDDEED